jgi:hypothetical protein
MAAQQSESELDRVWRALDGANAAIQDLERRLAKQPAQVAPANQCAPVPDYRIGESLGPVIDAQWPDVDTSHGVAAPVEPCSCEEALNLRGRVAELEAENEALDNAHRYVLSQRNAAQDINSHLSADIAAKSHDLSESLRLRAELEERLRAAQYSATTASDAVLSLSGELVEALRWKETAERYVTVAQNLEQQLAQATARASTAPASQADILCVEQVQTGLSDKLDALAKRVLKLEALLEEEGS